MALGKRKTEQQEDLFIMADRQPDRQDERRHDYKAEHVASTRPTASSSEHWHGGLAAF